MIVFCDAVNCDLAMGLFVHELSHNLPFAPRKDVLPTPELRQLQRNYIDRDALGLSQR
jgi:hypothetical protein